MVLKLKSLFFLLIILALVNLQPAYAAYEKSSTDHEISAEQIQHFKAAIKLIQNNYVEPVKDSKLYDGAMRGMLSSLDPHSSYLDEQDLKDLQDVTSGEFSGIGLEVSPENGLLKVITPLDDSPARKAGIKAGDIIIRVDKTPINHMTSREAVQRMRGKSGSVITLTIVRKGSTQPLNISMQRQIIKVQSVKSQLLAQYYGYIRISNFQATTETNVIKAINVLNKESGGQLKGLILDLRNNPGGLLDSSVDVANLFLDSEKLGFDRYIVYTKGRLDADQFRARATSNDIIHGIPMIILINGGSASAAEIVAGALQDYKRALVVGTTSFGKGSVQTVLPIDEKSAIKLTTALYYTPAGRSIQAQGITPDVRIEELKLPSPSKKESDEISFKEADLDGHLPNNSIKTFGKAVEDAINQVPQSTIAPGAILPTDRTDYQLNEALNLLKGLAALQQTSH